MTAKVALITGAARRIGATIARYLHAQGMNVIIHYYQSELAAKRLQEDLNAIRSDSATILKADLNQIKALPALIGAAHNIWQRLDVLINNASRFYPTPVGSVTELQWDDLFASNLKAPFFLAQAAAPYLRQQQGCIINIADIHGERPLESYPVYSCAKAGLIMLTKALAKELGPDIRVNAVAPGAILWPEHENELVDTKKNQILKKTALKRQGDAEDIAKAVWFFIENAGYVTGQVMAVDGGRML